jgi:hypothetical protein
MQRREDLRRTVTEDEWTPRTDEIEVPVAVDIPDPWAVTARDERRRPTDGPIGTNRAVDATRNQALRLLEEGRRPVGAYDGSRSSSGRGVERPRVRSKASVMTATSRVGSGLSRRARTGPWRNLAVSASASSRIA